MSDQDNGQVSTLQRPTTDDPMVWKAYWKAQGWSWRTEPEIDAERQKYLDERRAVVPDIEKGIYPFGGVKLSRADVEWLLATHENGRGPVDWHDPNQRNRKGLDLRGADLRLTRLHYLPLACMQGGFEDLTQEIRKVDFDRDMSLGDEIRIAAVHLEGANLFGSQLEEANLYEAHLEGTELGYTKLLEAKLTGAYMQKASLVEADLRNANLFGAHLEGANLQLAYLGGAKLDHAYLDNSTVLSNTVLVDKQIGSVSLQGVNWAGTDLTGINWKPMKMLGNELEARQSKKSLIDEMGTEYQKKMVVLFPYMQAIRANRQLAVVLRDQGLNEEAAYFAYRAQLCQRVLLRLQKKFGQYLFSLFLDLLAGYGYRPGRSVIWYLVTIFGFALAYFAIGHLPFLPDAFVFSLTSFHGRGFFPGLGTEASLHNPLVVMAAFEAVVGLLIEISFIATFTQRFFGR